MFPFEMLNSFRSVSNASISGQVFIPSYPTPSMPGSTRCHQHPVSDHTLYFTSDLQEGISPFICTSNKKEKKEKPMF